MGQNNGKTATGGGGGGGGHHHRTNAGSSNTGTGATTTTGGANPKSILRGPTATNATLVAQVGSSSVAAQEKASRGSGRASPVHNQHRDPMAMSGSSSSTNLPAVKKPADTNVFPVLVKYTVPKPRNVPGGQPPRNQGPKRVEMIAEFNGWTPIPLTPSESEFHMVVQMPKGEQNFKFIVDGEVTVDATQPRGKGDNSNCNTVSITEAAFKAVDDDDPTASIADGGGDGEWGQECQVFEDQKKFPPILPPHMRYTPLNQPMTQVRCDADGTLMEPTEDQTVDAENVPCPLPVTVNHVYFQRREDHFVVGTTTRYKNKYTTTVYYKAIQSQGAKSSTTSAAPTPSRHAA